MSMGVQQDLGPLDGMPTRHGADVRKARRIARPLRWVIKNVNPEPTPDQWKALGASLLRGDPLADGLAVWMRDQGMHIAQPLFERALNMGVHQVPEAPAELQDFFARVEATPDWVEPSRLIKGAKACHISGVTGMQVLRNAALMGGYQASAINRTLVLTGALSRGAQRRIAETTKWWIDCTTPAGLSRFSPGFKTTVRVRMMHALVRQRLLAMPEWNVKELGLPVNQGDMQATYLGFSTVFLLGQRMMGVHMHEHEAEAVMHLWRYIAWLLGVEEGLLFDTEMQGRVGLYQNMLSQAPPDHSSMALARALMDEPLHCQYKQPLAFMDAWQGRYERAKHLSICRFFLGSEGMRNLGLPSAVLPWYPLATIPLVAARHRLLRLLPGGRAHLVRHGRAEQEDHLSVLFGAVVPDIARLRVGG